MTTVLSFRCGGQDWAVALERVQRVLAARGLLPLPDPQPGVAGLLYRDGDTVPVLSALGGGQLGQVVVLDDRGRSVGCWTRSSASSVSEGSPARSPRASGPRWSPGSCPAPTRGCCSTWPP